MQIESILNIECSRAINKVAQPIDCNLLDELNNMAYLQQQNILRAELNETIQYDLKCKMPCLLISGKFSGSKSAKGLIKHTGLITIDIDEKDNRHISNFYKLKEEFCKIPNVAYCGLSVRGKGYFLIIPIIYPEKHQLHFQWIQKYFATNRVIIDPSGINVNRLRFYSYDPDAYFNHAAKPLLSYFQSQIKEPTQSYKKAFLGPKIPVWVQYNEKKKFIDVLGKHGWRIDSTKGSCKTYFTRPGEDKLSGISAEYDSDKNIFYVFTSNGKPFEGGTGYNPFQVYSLLDHNGDFRKAAKALFPSNSPYNKSQHQNIKSTLGFTPAPIKKVAELPEIVVSPPQADPMPLAPPDLLNIDQFIALATASYKLTMVRKKETFKPTYMELWADGMADILAASGITKQQFLNSSMIQ